MRRIVYGLLTIISFFMSIAALTAFIVMSILIKKLDLKSQLDLSLFALCCTSAVTLFCFIKFVQHCIKAKKKVSFKQLTANLADELNSIVVSHDVYLNRENDSELVEKDLQIRVENLADMIEKAGDLENNSDN